MRDEETRSAAIAKVVDGARAAGFTVVGPSHHRSPVPAPVISKSSHLRIPGPDMRPVFLFAHGSGAGHDHP